MTEPGNNIRELSDIVKTLRDRTERFEDDSDPTVRGLIATRVYRKNGDLPPVRKRAEIVARTLEQLRPTVLPEDGLAGVAFHRYRVHSGVSNPDYWRIQVMHPDRWTYSADWPVPDSVHDQLRWWRNHRIDLRGNNRIRRQQAWLGRYGIAHPHGTVGGHTLPDHGILLNEGVGPLRTKITERLTRASTDQEQEQLKAMDRCLEGLANHCRICAESARQKADELENQKLAERLSRTADRCEAIAEAPPTSFAEALQLLYFSNYTDRMDTRGDAASFGRIDQILAPFYTADLDAGRLTAREAFDLVCCFQMKQWSEQTSADMTVGGICPDGTDATNELSYIFLEAMEATGLVVGLSVRLHRNSPERFVQTVARVLRRSLGRPSVFNDEVTIEALVKKGVQLEDARDYAPLGCVEVMIPGRSSARTMGMGLNLLKILELTLNRGKCLITGDTVLDDMPGEFDSFESLLDEYHKQIRKIVDVGVEIIREDERNEPDVFPRPWLTVLSRGGIEDARDMTAGQPRYNPVGVTLDGLADVVNSLNAVRRLVFEEESLAMPELREILRADWQGHEPLRKRVIHRFGRFGQDLEHINSLTHGEARHYAGCFESHRTFYGDRFWPMIFGVTPGLIWGKAPKTGATAGGRRNGAPITQSLMPCVSGPRGGPTELLNSVAAVDYHDFPGGVSNVQEFAPGNFTGEKGIKRLAILLRSFFKQGGMEISLNFVDEKTLRAARQNPERFDHLTVRLFGLSVKFINLSEELQQNVIERVSAARRAG